MDLEAMKAAYLAKGGTVTVVAEGEGAGISNRDWRAMVRGDVPARMSEDEREGAALYEMQRVREERGYYGS